RRGELGRGARLLVIVEMADQLFGVLIGVEEIIDLLGGEARAAVEAALRAGLEAAAARLDDIADRVVVEQPLPALPALAWNGSEARARLDGLSALARAEAEHALALIARIHDDVAAALSVVESLDDERDRTPSVSAAHSLSQPLPVDLVALASAAPAPVPSVQVADSLPWNEALRASLALDSVVLRHALRVATVALAAVLVTRALDLQRGYWASLTAVLLLQPYLPATITRGLQRVGGTIAGGVIATVIAAIVHDPLGIAIISITLAGVSAAVIQLNYGLYALFLTPTFVLLAEVHARDGHLVQLRITNTLLGAGLAVIGALLLWPSRESTRTGDRLADALDAGAGYLHEVLAAAASHAPAHAPAELEARRAAGRAFNHADLSLDRLVAEGPPPKLLEPQMAVVTMIRRLTASLSAFASARTASDPDAATPVLGAIRRDAETFLHAAAAALRDDGAPAPPAYQRHDALVGALPPLLAARVLRVDLQLSIIAEAVSRTLAVTRGPRATA
ncbi:MAG TPA: FUSC family protein, partial [Kofleriaceae bacterium]|nr:FUSC family protein [Kofleriaceae bacterium]